MSRKLKHRKSTKRGSAAPENGGVSGHLPDIAKILRRKGVAHVSIEYGGEWDDGSMFAPLYYSAGYMLLNPPVPASTSRKLKMFLRELLELRCPGWDNAEGSRGYFEWGLGDDNLIQIHAWRHVRYKYKTFKGL